MHTAEARIATEHASRYIAQLCRHAGKMGQHKSGSHLSRSGHDGQTVLPILHVECSDTFGSIRLGDGQCTLQAGEDALLVRVEAGSEMGLRRLQDGIARRLETFGHREHLKVHWQPLTSTSQLEEIPDRVPAHDGPMTVRWRSRLVRNLALAAAAAVAIAAHLGLLGVTLAAATWMKWGATAIFALIVVKFVTMGVTHIAGGTVAYRRAKGFLSEQKRRHQAGKQGTEPKAKKPGLVLHNALGYDLLVWLFTRGRENALREMIVCKADLQLGETVLDIGCGTGSLAIAAKKKIGPTGRMHGIDASPQMILRAQKKAEDAGVDVSFKIAAVQELPFSDGQFDVVLSTMMFHHLSRTAQRQCAAEIERVLRPGGRVLVIDFAQPERVERGILNHLHRRHGHVDLQNIIAPLEAARLSLADSGALGIYDLQFVLAEASVAPDAETIAGDANVSLRARSGP